MVPWDSLTLSLIQAELHSKTIQNYGEIPDTSGALYVHFKGLTVLAPLGGGGFRRISAGQMQL